LQGQYQYGSAYFQAVGKIQKAIISFICLAVRMGQLDSLKKILGEIAI
jgi:hypothetical protein